MLKSRLVPILLPVCVAALLLLGGWAWLRSYTRHNVTVRVPELQGLSFAEAEAITLIAPNERSLLAEFRSNGYSTFLARPVRGETLLRVLMSEPARRGAPPAAPQSATAASKTHPAHPGQNVLVAEDNEVNQLVFGQILSGLGLSYRIAGNGRTAVEMYRTLGPKLILMDVSMPGLDGLEATYALKAQLPDVTVLMLSVGDKEQEIAAGLAGGAAEYLVKGGPAREIVDAIKRYGPVPGTA